MGSIIHRGILRRIGTIRCVINIISVGHLDIDWEFIIPTDRRYLRSTQFLDLNMVIFGNHWTTDPILIDVDGFDTVITAL